jgi:hypothetical protein
VTSVGASPIDLKQYLSADVQALRHKLQRSIIAHVPADRWHDQVDGGGSTIAHLLLHLARHHDLAINSVVRNKPPLFATHAAALGLADAPAGVAVSEREERALTADVPSEALVAYLSAVFDSTATWHARTGSMMLDTVPDASRRLMRHAALSTHEFGWLHDLWADKPVWWLVQWPVIGHGNAHLGELLSLRNRLGLSSF